MILSSTRDAFILEAFLKRLSRRELSGKRISSIEQNAVASYVVQEHCVPGLHGPVGEQHIDLTRGIKVHCARIDNGGKDVFPIGLDEAIRRVKDGQQIHITWAGVVKRSLFMPGNGTEENHRQQDVGVALDQHAQRFFDKRRGSVVEPCWNRCHFHESFLLGCCPGANTDRKSTRLNSSHQIISYAVFCLKKK